MDAASGEQLNPYIFEDWLDDIRGEWLAYLRELDDAHVELEVFVPSLLAYGGGGDAAADEALATRAGLQRHEVRHMIVRASTRLFDVEARAPMLLLHLWCKRASFTSVGHLEHDASRALFDDLVVMGARPEAWTREPGLWAPLGHAELEQLKAVASEVSRHATYTCSARAWQLLCGVGLAAWMYGAHCPRNEAEFEGRDVEGMFFDVAMPVLRRYRLVVAPAAPQAPAAVPQRTRSPEQRPRAQRHRPTAKPSFKSVMLGGHGLRHSPYRVAQARKAGEIINEGDDVEW